MDMSWLLLVIIGLLTLVILVLVACPCPGGSRYFTRRTVPRAESETNLTPSSSFDNDLQKLADMITANKDIEALGKALGFRHEKIGNYIKTNMRFQNVTSEGTLAMLRDWNKNVKKDDERSALREALMEANLVRIADDIFKSDEMPIYRPQALQPCLTDTEVEKCRRDLEHFYRTELCLIRDDPLNPLSYRQFEDIYTNLKMRTEDCKEWKDLDYNNLLDKANGVLPKRLIVQGKAGAGKTTLCAKIAWDWVNGTHFQQFKMVIVAPLREAESYTVGQIVKGYLLSNNTVEARQLDEYILLNPDKVFIIFDGLDEYKRDIEGRGRSKLNKLEVVLECTSSYAIPEIISSDLLETCLVLVTSRPWKVDQIKWNFKLIKVYSFIRVEGFTEANLAKYIRKNFKNDEARATDLIQFTQENDVVAENMAPFPIYVAMLCQMWKVMEEERRQQIQKLQTFSQFFQEMIWFLKEHFVLKSCKSLEDPLREITQKELDELLQPISRIAFHGVLNRNMIFDEKDFQDCVESLEAACKVGILTKEKKLNRHRTSHSVQSTVSFPHKLFQEYMAGLHLDHLWTTDREAYDLKTAEDILARKEELKYLLYFGTSQSEDVGIDILKRLSKQCVDHKPELPITLDPEQADRQKDFIVDLAFECHHQSAAEIVEAGVLQGMSSLTIGKKKSAHTLAGYMFVLTELSDVSVSYRQCQLIMSRQLAETFCCLRTMRTCTLRRCSLHWSFYNILATRGQQSTIQKLILWSMELEDSDLRNLLTWMGLSGLKHFEIHSMHTGKGNLLLEILSSMATSLKVQTLGLFGISLDKSQSRHLASTICCMPDLDELILGKGGSKTARATILEEFCDEVRQRMASSRGNSNHIAQGDFKVNGVPCADVDTFLTTLRKDPNVRIPRSLSNMPPRRGIVRQRRGNLSASVPT